MYVVYNIGSSEHTIEDRARSPSEVQLLITIPGVSYYIALTIYTELGEIKRFSRDKEVVSYVALNPMVYKSGDSQIEGKHLKAWLCRIRWVLVQASNTAVYTSHDEYLSQFYN
jgi:transposase